MAPPAWTLQGTISSTSVQPGGTLRVQGTLRLFSSTLGPGSTTHAKLVLERLTGPDGQGTMAQALFASTFMTPTGLPIERTPSFGSDTFTQSQTASLARTAADRLDATIDLTLQVPASLLAGYYRPYVSFTFQNVPLEPAPPGALLGIDRGRRRPFNDELQPTVAGYAPIVKIGSPSAPRMFWTMLTDDLSNGSRGVSAAEDRNKFGLASRILTQSETFVVPRNDSAGRPITYRLEPFAPTISASDRGEPENPPLIPFRFPSGNLTVQVQKPDGTTQTLGPAPFVQSRSRGLVNAQGVGIDDGGGYLQEVYQLSTLDSRFNFQFPADGRYVITVDGTIDDIWGNTWRGGGTYEVNVGRILVLDTATIPTTPFEVGDVFDPGVVVSPAIPATVQVRFRMAPNSDSTRITDRTVTWIANRFGYSHPAGGGITLDQAGEYRVDISASYVDAQGNLWMGSRTWGGVVASKTPSIIAHGRRGINGHGQTPFLQWFTRPQIGQPVGPSHFPFTFQSGDITWVVKGDASNALMSFQDPVGNITSIMRTRSEPPGETPFYDGLAAAANAGEFPLYSSRADNADPHLDPSKVDVYAYSYRGAERPLVRVREIIGEDNLGGGTYWRFNEQYSNQVGVGVGGDLPNDFKFQYGAVVIRGSAIGNPQYAVYGSLFTVIPDSDTVGSRTFPPFQGNGGGPTGGPIMRLKGRSIDMFFHPTAVRPGSVLEVGDTFAIAGAIGPTLAGLVSTTVTLPSGRVITSPGRGNKVGYYYHPENDFVVDEAGIYTVDVSVTFDGQTSAGQVTQPFPRGDVLGTANGRFYVYVVPRGGPALNVNATDGQMLAPPANLQLSATAPEGFTLQAAHVTATMPGFVLNTGPLQPSGNSLSYGHNPPMLAADFPNLDLDQPADLVTFTLFSSIIDASGNPTYAARVISLRGNEVMNPVVGRTVSFGISNRGGTSLSSTGRGGATTVGYGRIRPGTGSTAPSGLAIFGFRQNGTLVTEAAVPATAAITSGRIYAEVDGAVDTGLAIANPNGQPANISFYFSDATRTSFGAGTTTIAPNGQIAAFLDQAPFNGGASINGTFTFTSDVPVAVIALRGLTNERSEFLITTLPVSALSAATGETVYFPHFADGDGWSSQLILVNPTDEVINGTVNFFGQGTPAAAATPVSVTIDGQAGTSFSYSVPPRSSKKLRTSGQSSPIRAGSVRVIPAAGNKTPTGLAVFSYRSNGVTVSEAGVPATRPVTALRLYAEVSGGTDQIQTGIAISNSASSPVTVNIELTTLTGASTGLTGSVVVPGNGQIASFLNQIQGFTNIAAPFKGVLRISTAAASGISVVGLRGRYNERSDFLVTTTSPVNESASATTAEVFFPHLADSGGYTTQFILFSGTADQTASGTVEFFTQAGQGLNLTLR
jgi:hypothetical protein